MKITKLMRNALCVVVFAALGLVGCSKLDIYSIDSPADLQKNIDSIANILTRQKEIADSIAAAKAAAMEARLTEDIYQVGNTDNTSGWWGGHSKYYRLATNSDSVYVKFKNFTEGKNVWCNWVQAITNDVPRGGTGYLEYAIWRADNYSNFAWGTENGVGWNTSTTGDTHGTQQTTNYAKMATENKNFAAYTELMNGADCIALIRRGGDSIYVEVQMTSVSGQKLTKSYYIIENGIKDKPIRVFWTIENCHLVFYKTLTQPLTDFSPNFELDPNWNGTPVVPVEPVVTTYRADMKATITTASNTVFNYTYYAEGIKESGFGSFLLIEGGHMDMDPVGTYYCALADTANSPAWFYPYSATTTVGAVDNTTPWWSAFTNYTAVTGDAFFHYKFVNYTNGLANWNNWVLALTNGQSRSSKKYAERFLLRADNFGWGTNYTAGNLTNNYDWANFTSNMNGATVEISLKITEEVTAKKKSSVISTALKPGMTIQ